MECQQSLLCSRQTRGQVEGRWISQYTFSWSPYFEELSWWQHSRIFSFIWEMPLLFGFLLRCVCLLFGVDGGNNGALFLLVYYYIMVLEFKPRTFYMLGRCSTVVIEISFLSKRDHILNSQGKHTQYCFCLLLSQLGIKRVVMAYFKCLKALHAPKTLLG